MKKICRKGTAIMLTLLMILAFIPQGVYATSGGGPQRSATLDLTGEVVSYATSGGTENADPTEGNITDSVEGWKWYLDGDDEKGYGGSTLELSGITLVTNDPLGIKLPAGATIVLMDGTANIVKSLITNSYSNTYAIQGMGDLTIKGGSGTLSATGGDTESCNTSGVMAEGALSIQGGNITAISGDTPKMSYSIICTGIRANQTITITGGTVYAKTGYNQSSPAVYVANWYDQNNDYGLIVDGMEAYQKNKINDEYTLEARAINGVFVFSEPPYDSLTANDVRITPLPTPSFSGQGTEADPYLITSKEELKEMSQFVNDQNGRYGNKNYKLTADIVLNTDLENEPEQWMPIGANAPFTGVFDGDGHTVKGLYIDSDDMSEIYHGLFGSIRGGTVKGIGLIDGNVTSSSVYACAGSLAGILDSGTIEDCYNTGIVIGKSVGGIIGLNNGGDIRNCYNTGEISGLGNYSAAGGIAGQNLNSSDTIVNCYNTGNVTISLSNDYDQGYAGGITGQNGGSSIRNCYNVGTISSEAPEEAFAFIGAIAGASDLGQGGVIEHAYWLDTTAGTAIGMEPNNGSALARTNSSGGSTSMTETEMKSSDFVDTLNNNVNDLHNTYATLSPWKTDRNNTNGGYPILGTENASFSGAGTEADPYLITSKEQLKEMSKFVNSQNSKYGDKNYRMTADIVLNNDIAVEREIWTPIGQDRDTRFAGVFDGGGHTISGIYIDGTPTYAGLFGYIKSGTVKNVKVGNGQIYAANGDSYAGSISAYNSYGRIEDCSSTADVGGTQSGGITGYNNRGHIQDCSNSGTVAGIVAGGIAGANVDADYTIVNCFNTGVVMAVKGGGTAYAGGIAGVNMESSIKNCYNAGTISSVGPEDTIAKVGGIFGSSVGGTIDHAYWLDSSLNADTAHRYNNTGSEEVKTSAELKALTQTLNNNVAEMKNESGLSPWKADANNQNSGYPLFGTAVQNGSSSGSSGGHGSSAKSDNTNTANIVVNGKSQSAGKSETVTGKDGKITTTVTVDSDKLKSLLSTEKNGAKVTIAVADSANTAEGRLTGEMVKSMEDKSATLIIQRGASSYSLPAAEINISEISKKLGTSVSLSDITVSVKISEPSDAMAKIVKTSEQSKGFTVVAPTVDFTITCTYGGKSVTSSSFNAYVERTIAIPAGVDPSKITTGIVVDPNGTVYHVPTRVTVIDGKYYAVINSLTNSTYSVIWNPVTFSDMANHWAKDSVNNMGSRMVVTGVGNNNYAPGRNMTRAEFSAVIVRALGLAPDSEASNFSDVKTSDWYNGYIETAVEHGIIKGYDNGKFGPNDTITREQAMTMLARAMKVTGLSIDLTDKNISELAGEYTDGASISAYAKESVAACLETGITSGRGNHLIAPKSSITRAEVAIMAERLLKKSDLI